MKTLKGTCKHCGHIQEETTKHDNVSCSTGYCDECSKVGMNMYPDKDWEEEFDRIFCSPHDAEREFFSEDARPKYVKDFIREQIKQAKIEERERAALIVEELMEDYEHWQPIAGRILGRTIIRKEDIKNLEREKWRNEK